MQLQPGHLIGRYKIVSTLGQGGMASVYLAFDSRLDRQVAIKVLRTGAFPQDSLDQVLQRFEREAKSLAGLSHANIVNVIDYGDQDGAPYLVLEYLPGGTLSQWLGKPVPYLEAVRMLLPVTRALTYAHREGIIHRDVKPSNILLSKEGEPKLADFGIAKLLEDSAGQSLTGTGVGIGTPEYMAPEQGLGHPVDARVDVYAIGIVLYEMVTGKKPFTADTPMEVVLKHCTLSLPSIREIVPELPIELEQILVKALAKNPEERFTDMAELSSELIGLLRRSEAIDAHPAHRDQPVVETTIQVLRHTSDASPMGLTRDPDATIQTREEDGGQIHPINQPEHPEAGIENLVKLNPLVEARRTKSRRSLWMWGLPLLALLIMGALPLLLKLKPSEAALVTALPTLEAAPMVVVTSTSTPYPPVLKDAMGVEMALVPAGEFTMGFNNGEPNVQPAHQVYLDSFYIDIYEVTNARYAECVKAGHCSPPSLTRSNTRSSYYGNEAFSDYPVIYVNWNFAQAYCTWRGGRLPTEAEWEKAARGGLEGGQYPWGDDKPTCTYGHPNEANFNLCNNPADTWKVDNLSKNGYGLYGTAGNVWEWVSDWSAPYDSSLQMNPTGPSEGFYRVLRGGSWDSHIRTLTVYHRYEYDPEYRFNSAGIRCAMTPK